MNKINLSSIAFLISALVLVFLSFTLVLNPKARKRLNALIQKNERTIIATLETNLSISNKKFKILKIKSNQDLWIEIYDLTLSEDRIAQFKLPLKFDGQMFINKKTSSLFASDLDGDQILEVISPTFNIDLHPKIHAFRYNPITDKFSEISDQDLLQKLNM